MIFPEGPGNVFDFAGGVQTMSVDFQGGPATLVSGGASQQCLLVSRWRNLRWESERECEIAICGGNQTLKQWGYETTPRCALSAVVFRGSEFQCHRGGWSPVKGRSGVAPWLGVPGVPQGSRARALDANAVGPGQACGARYSVSSVAPEILGPGTVLQDAI